MYKEMFVQGISSVWSQSSNCEHSSSTRVLFTPRGCEGQPVRAGGPKMVYFQLTGNLHRGPV